MRGRPRISSIYRMGEPATPPDPERTFTRIWRWSRDLWIQRGTIVARPNELPDDLAQQLVAWANDQYGERRHGKR